MTRHYRTELRPDDVGEIRRIVEATGFFYPFEVDVAVELAEDRLEHGAQSEYMFLCADGSGRLAGYSCFGPIPCTRGRWDLFWIVVDPQAGGKGLGTDLLLKTEEQIRSLGGERVYAETSGRELYAPTRRFYETRGFVLDARLKDFYDNGDDKLVYMKRLAPR